MVKVMEYPKRINPQSKASPFYQCEANVSANGKSDLCCYTVAQYRTAENLLVCIEHKDYKSY